jgi:hypothetical protein
MKSTFAAAFVWLCVLCGTPGPAQTKRALLIGINTYEPAGTRAQHPDGCTYGRCELGYFENLDGAVNDAQSMADVLTSPKFGFPSNQVVLLTNPAPPHPGASETILPAGQTTRDGILAAMQKYLVDVPHSGDTVVFYAASHGSLRINSKGTKLTVLVNGKYVPADSTLVPSDAYKGGYDVRDREMTHIFNAALDKGIHLTVILDNCHSGGISRGIQPKYRQRDLPFDPRDVAEAPVLLPSGDPPPAPTERKDNPALVLSAVQQDQSAKETPDTVPPTEPHGAFTAALVEALQVLPADAPAAVVYQRVRAVIQNEDVPDEDPDLDATAQRREQPLFGGAATASDKIRTAALGTSNSGAVWLDVGRVSGVGVGSEFTATLPNSDGQKVQLRVTALEGIARSVAEVVSPQGAKVSSGDIFEMTKWSPAQSAPLSVWHWPATLAQADILAAAAQIQAAGMVSVSDPAAEPWTHILSWDGTNWTLQQAGAPLPAPLGATLTAAALRKKIPAGAKLWVNLPPSRELVAQLLPPDPNSAVQTVATLASAEYALTGVLTPSGPAWAWFHKNELAAGPPPPQPQPSHSWLLCGIAISRPQRLGRDARRERDGKRRSHAESLRVAAGQGAWLARDGQQPRRRFSWQLLFAGSGSVFRRIAARPRSGAARRRSAENGLAGKRPGHREALGLRPRHRLPWSGHGPVSQGKFGKPVSQRIRYRQSVSDPGRACPQNRSAFRHGYLRSPEHRAAVVRSFCAQLRGRLALARRRAIAAGTTAEQYQQRDPAEIPARSLPTGAFC